MTKCTGGMKPVTTVSTVHPDRNIQVWGSLALHSTHRMPLSLLSLSDLESAQNLAGSCLTVCDQLLTSHSDLLLLPEDSIAAWTGCLPFLGLPCFLFSSVSFSFFFFSSSSLSFFFLCLSSSLSFFCLSLSLFFSSHSSLRFFFSSPASFSCLSFSFIISTYSFSVNTRAFIILRFDLFKVSSSREEKRSARYEGASPAATKGLVMGVPLSDLEVDDTGVELNKGGHCAEEHDQYIYSLLRQ